MFQLFSENEPPVPAPDLEPVRDVTVVNPATDLPQDTPALNIPTPAGAKRETPVLVDLQTPQVNVCKLPELCLVLTSVGICGWSINIC